MFGDIQNVHGEKIDYTFHSGGSGQRKVVVIGHGVTGNKDRPFVVALAEGLAAAGMNALRFSFSGNGDSGGRFVDSTITKEVADLGSVLDRLNNYTVCYAGHSMGGAVGVTRASKDPRIQYLVSLAGMVHTKDFAEREFGQLKPGVGFMWDEETCPLSQAYMDDLRQIDSVVGLAPRIQVPWLLVHGSEDDVVPVGDSQDILAKAGSNAELVTIPGANHVFAEEHCATMVTTVTEWVKKQFS